MGVLILGLLLGIVDIEQSISFVLFIEKEAIDTLLMAVFQALRNNLRSEAMRLLLEIETVYLKTMYADLDTVWGGGVGFDVGGTHLSAFYGYGTFRMFADAVFDSVQGYKEMI